MRAPLSWLRDFAPIEGTPEDLARALSFLGLVVEGVEKTGPVLPGIVVARVLSTRRHPSADRIQLVDVDPGDGQAVQVCCGAFNMEVGDLVPLATVGTVMPNGLPIGRRKMRGEWSNGMLCSASELQVGPEGPEPAILVLPPGSAQPGTPVAEVLGWQPDVVFDLDVSPNRPDCFSVMGIARDLAAALGAPFQPPAPAHVVAEGVPRANVSVADDARELCPRLTGTVIEGIPEVRAPAFVARRLVLAGMRPINPVVDVSNYVMLELGQPNHPYDLERLGGAGLVARRGSPGEEVVTLDGAVRRLSAEDCVIADAQGAAVGVGGIMGGRAAEISDSTRTVLLEVACFNPRAISATGKRLGLLSEARTRFERGVDPELAPLAVDRFVELLGPGARRGPTADVRSVPPAATKVRLRASRANLVLGTSLSGPDCARLLRPLGFVPLPQGDDELEVEVPSWRPDCEREVDLIEEVARLYGYDNIARSLPPRPPGQPGLSPYQRDRRKVRDILAGAGASEAWTSSFCSLADLERAGLGTDGALEVENPLDQSQGWLRPSLLPGLLAALRYNRERQAGALCLFEVGNVFARPGPQDDGARPLAAVVEQEHLGLVATGQGADAAYAVQVWQVLAQGLRLPGPQLLQGLLPHEGQPPHEGELPQGGGPTLPAPPGQGQPFGPSQWLSGAWAALHPGRRAVAHLELGAVGVVGELAPEVARRHDIDGRVAVLLLDLSRLLGHPRRAWEALPVSRFPAVDFDLAFVVDEDVPAADVGLSIAAAAGDVLESYALFDVWRDASLGAGRRSLAFHLRLRALDRTLTEADAAGVRQRVVKAVSERHGALLRGG